MGKRRKKKTVKGIEQDQDAEDELLALAAIYGDDLRIDEDGHGFHIRVLPHPAELQDNRVSVVLAVRLPAGYPQSAAVLRLCENVGIEMAEQRALSKQLHTAAMQSAAEGTVCAFDLINACQTFLQERNSASAALPGSVAPSLWHEMRQRETGADAPDLNSSSSADAAETGQLAGLGVDLFDAATAPDVPARHLSPKRDHTGIGPGQRLANAAAEDSHTQLFAAEFPAAAQPSTASPAADAAGAAPAADPAGSRRVFRRMSSGGEVSGSIVRSMLGAVRSGFTAVGRALLPPSLHKLLEGEDTAHSNGSGGDSASGSEPEAEMLRKDLLVGHLLALATEDGLPRHALPALASSLQIRGLLPKWVQWALTQQPALFDRAFRRLFSQELDAAAKAGASGDPLTSWALERFWRPAAGAQAPPRAPPPIPGIATSGEIASRYKTDFQEVRVLGRGGFGVVVAAVNRLDGRQYAVKRIRLDAASPAAFARLLREVATLSRLQHPHVVRYFQAWFETDNGTEQHTAGFADTEDDNDDWLTSGSTSTPSGGRTVSFALPNYNPDLQPVPEESWREGSPTNTLLGSTASQPPHSATSSSAATDSSGPGMWQLRSSPAANTSRFSSVSGFISDDTSLADMATKSAVTVDATDSSSGNSNSSTDQQSEAAAGTDTAINSAGDLNGLRAADNNWQRQPPVADSGSRKQASRQAPQRLLYIQMELCPRTLRQVLDNGLTVSEDGQVDEASAWQVVRQTLSGLAHIHSQNIIHRDLKPENLFYDARGDIRLGDFGLAKFTAGGPGADAEEDDAVAAAAIAVRKAESRSQGGMPSEASGVLGTSFYIAPEIEQGWASYDHSVDLFSLAIVVFELWHPFSTGMERVLRLRELRATGGPPADFVAAHPQVAKLVTWLMAPQPNNRPSAREVLASELLPPTVGDQALTDMLRSLPDSPDTLDRVLAAVFAVAPQAALTPAAAEEAAGAPLPLQVGAREQVVEAIRAVFGRHGAVATSSAALGLAGPEDEVPGAPLLLAPSGARLALRHELRRPFASCLARQAAAAAQGGEALDAVRRYEVATLRRRTGGRGAPAAHLAADLDLVAPRATSATETAIPEAEAILAVAEIVAALPEAGSCEVRLGHRALAEAALSFAGLPGNRDLRAAAQQLLATAAGASPLDSAARAKRWPAIRVGLEGLGLDGGAIGRCRALVLQLPGEAAAALHRCRTRLAPAGGSLPPPLAAALDHLQEVIGHLGVWGIAADALVLDPLLAPHADYFTSALAQVHLRQPGGGTSLLAVGGRYDALLKLAWPAAAVALGPPPGAVGMTVNADRLVSAVANAAARSRGGRAGILAPSQAEVLICAKGGGGLLRERMALAASLWAGGIKAEFLPTSAPSLQQQYEYARAAGVSWMVTIAAATFSAADTVMVKHLERKGAEEESIPKADVARYLQEAMAAAHSTAPARYAGTRHFDLIRSASAAVPDADAGIPGDADGEGSAHGGNASSWRDRRKGRR